MTVLPAQIGPTCANISQNDFQVLDGESENIAYFCSYCLPDVTKALEIYPNSILNLKANFSQWRINYTKELAIKLLSTVFTRFVPQGYYYFFAKNQG